MEEYYGYVYKILDTKHDKIYIGQKKGKVEKTKNYFGSGTIIKDIIKSRGTSLLIKTILCLCYSKEELLEKETKYKMEYDSFWPKGYNIVEIDGHGDFLKHHPDKDNIREKNGKNRKGKHRKPSPKITCEHCGKIIDAGNYGKWHGDNCSVKTGIPHKGVMQGKNHSDISKIKISKSHKGKPKLKLRGRPLSEDHKKSLRKPKSAKGRKNISEAHKGKTQSEETRKKIAKSMKDIPKIVCAHCGKVVSPSIHTRFHGDNCYIKTGIRVKGKSTIKGRFLLKIEGKRFYVRINENMS